MILLMDYFKQALGLILSGDRELWVIIRTTLVMSFFSTIISSLIGIPLGVALGRAKFRGKGIIIRITNTLMGLPPVVAGLVVFMLFRSVGPLGSFRIMFTVEIMVVAQVLLITPLMTGMTASAAGVRAGALVETARGIGLSPPRQILLLTRECMGPVTSVVLMGFGRSIAEVGAVSLVGGNIQLKTRVMTTAIMLETNKGNFDTAIALGMLLMLLSLIVNSLAVTLQEKIK